MSLACLHPSWDTNTSTLVDTGPVSQFELDRDYSTSFFAGVLAYFCRLTVYDIRIVKVTLITLASPHTTFYIDLYTIAKISWAYLAFSLFFAMVGIHYPLVSP